MNNISKIFGINEKLACITLDFEMDYGNRTGEFNLLRDEKGIDSIAKLFSSFNIPISAFIVTDLLTNYPKSLDAVRFLAEDFHCHSHTHETKTFDSKTEISIAAATFEKHFGYKALGYRAPQGVLHNGDIELIHKNGFKFSASVFPTFRPYKFNNLSLPVNPFIYKNGIIELPFAVIPKLRYTISLSYLKLLGMSLNRILFSAFGLPNLIIFDSHLHDYIISEESFSRLPPKLRYLLGINKYSGMKYFKKFIGLLKKENYRFITVTELYHHIKEKYL